MMATVSVPRVFTGSVDASLKAEMAVVVFLPTKNPPTKNMFGPAVIGGHRPLRADVEPPDVSTVVTVVLASPERGRSDAPGPD